MSLSLQSDSLLLQKDSLVKTIDFLKKDIQYLIDKKKTTRDEVSKYKIEQEKNLKMESLKEASTQLKQITELEKSKKQMALDYKMTARMVDSIQFGGARKSKNTKMMEKAKSEKESRDKIRDQYNEYLKYEELYKQVDPQTVPAVLFFHDLIIKEYGLCPYIKVELEDTEYKETTKKLLQEKREQWLALQNDNGAKFRELYNKLFLLEGTNIIQEQINEYDILINNFIKDFYTESQFDLLTTTIGYIQEYTECQIKTKRLKEKYKLLINNLSILYSETLLNLHEYLTIKYKYPLIINDIAKTKNNTTKIDLTTKLYIEQFDELLSKYKLANAELEQEKKYITNTLKNIKNELYLFFTEQKSYETTNKPKQMINQVGKYFKKWTLLTSEERSERFMTFASYYIEKFMVRENILDEKDKAEKITDLFNLINNAYNEKRLVYRNFKWNIQKGIIEQISVLRYNKENSQFILAANAGPKPISSVKRKTSTKTVLSRETEQMINEEILNYIIQHKSDKSADDYQDKCLDIIKNKLKVKKLSAKDKEVIVEKIKNIWNVVSNNKR